MPPSCKGGAAACGGLTAGMQLFIWSRFKAPGVCLFLCLRRAGLSCHLPVLLAGRWGGAGAPWGCGASTLHPLWSARGGRGTSPGGQQVGRGCFLTDEKVVPVVCPEQLGSDHRSLGGPFRLSPPDTQG